MPYIIKNKCIYKKNKDGTPGMKVGCTKNDVQKYLKALIINVKENKESRMKKSNKIKSDGMEHTYIINFKNGSEQSFKKTYKNLLQYINSNEYNIVNIEDIHGNVIWGKNKGSGMKNESKLTTIIRKMIKEEITKKKLNENSVAYKKYALTDKDDIEDFEHHHDYTADEYNKFLKSTTSNFKSATDAYDAFMEFKKIERYASVGNIVKYIVSKKPKTKEDILNHLQTYLKKVGKYLSPDFESYNMTVDSIIDKVSIKLKIPKSNMLDKMSLTEFKKQHKKEPVVGFKWKATVGDPGVGYFEYEVKKIENDVVYYKTDSSNVRELTLGDVI